MLKRKITMIAALSIAPLLGGCSNMGRTTKTTLLGTGIGAGVGAIAGGSKGTAIGAGVGALSGFAVGAYEDKREEKMIEQGYAPPPPGVVYERPAPPPPP